MTRVQPGEVLLEVEGLTKEYPSVRALDSMSMSARRGELVGLIGENGAGKSTLLNILSGTEQRDAGTVHVRGRPVEFNNYRDATLQGVFRIFQELALVPNLRVHENFFLSHERRFETYGVLGQGRSAAVAQRILERFDHGWIDARATTGDYSFAVRQVLEIIKAFSLAEVLGTEAPILLLDEPTAALASSEVEFLRELIEYVRPYAAIVFVSHRLSEIREWSDRIVVMKDGRVVAETTPTEATDRDLHYLMVGRRRDEMFYVEHRQRDSLDAKSISVRAFSGPGFRDVSFEVHGGEIVGVGGLLGSGKSELGRAIFGASPWTSGSLAIDGTPVDTASVQVSVQRGMGYVPPERREDGIFMEFPVLWNVSFGSIVDRPTREGGWRLRPRAERDLASRYVERLNVKPPKLNVLARTLSGGNQQKVVLARWLALGVHILVLDNPTRGIDAGAKEEIYEILREIAEQGVAIVLISDDLLELIGLSNRIVVMKDGSVTQILDAPRDSKPDEASIVAAMS